MDSETADEIKRHFEVVAEGFHQSLRDGLNELRTELRTEIGGLRTELRAEIGGLRTELRAEIQDVKRHSDVIAASLRGEIRLVAEGVAGLDEKFTPEFRNVREEIGEVKTLLRLSYADLDRRLRPS
jgi:hypothetical protein